MKLIRVINKDGFKTYTLNKVERVTYKGKTYITSRYVNYPKTNTLTLRKQAIVNQLIKDDMSISEIAEITGVSESTIKVFLSEQIKEENYHNSQKNANKTSNTKKVKVVCYTDKSIIIYNSVIAAAEAIGCSNSNVSIYCKSGNIYKHKQTKKSYRMAFVED